MRASEKASGVTSDGETRDKHSLIKGEREKGRVTEFRVTRIASGLRPSLLPFVPTPFFPAVKEFRETGEKCELIDPNAGERRTERLKIRNSVKVDLAMLASSRVTGVKNFEPAGEKRWLIGGDTRQA